MRHNQETLGNGCLCDSGCEACDRLAEAFTALREALFTVAMLPEASRWTPPLGMKVRKALDKADEVLPRGR